MSASNKKIWIVLGASSAVGLAAALYVARLVGERNERRIVTSQVSEWAVAWDAARSCLVGDAPALARGSDAFLYRAATHVPAGPSAAEWPRACKDALGRLARPGDESTGNDAVEASWQNMRAATRTLVNAYALALDDSRDGARMALAAGVDAVDEAYARLRADARMEPAPPPGTGAATTLEPGTTVLAGNVPVPPQSVELAGDMLLVQGTALGVTTLAIVRDPARIEIERRADTTLRAADDAPWAVWFERGAGDRLQMSAGPLGDDGLPAGAGTVAVTASPREDLSAHFALGKDALRAVVYETIQGDVPVALRMVRSTDGGLTWSAPITLASGPRTFWLDHARRRFDLAWADERGSVRWLPVRADRLEQLVPPRRLFDAADGAASAVDGLSLCMGNQASWWLEGHARLHHVAGDGKAALQVDGVSGPATLERCTDEEALLVSSAAAGMQIARCDARACKPLMTVPVADGAEYRVAIGAAHGPVAVTRTARLLLVWKPGEAPAALSLPAASASGDDAAESLHAVVEWNGVLHAILRSDRAIRLIPLPLG